jgi:molecular chaperone DnaJ
LYVEVDVEDDPRFERDGVDLVTRVRVPFADAALGGDITVPALDSEDGAAGVEIAIPAGTQSGAVFTVKGSGIPRLDGRGRGSLVVIVQIEVPTALTQRARELLEQLGAELRGSASDEREAKRAVAGK